MAADQKKPSQIRSNSQPQSWSAIIICYNEEETIEWAAATIRQVISDISGGNFEIIIVDDGSTDRSPEIISNISSTSAEFRVIRHEKNRGIGAALRSGYQNATKTNLVILPADGEFDVEEFRQIPHFESNTIISFYRKQKTGYSLFRKFISFLNKFILFSILKTPIKDVNFVKIFKREEVQSIRLRLRSSLLQSELCAKLVKSGAKVIEIESTYQRRRGGKSTGASTLNVFRSFREIMKFIKEVKRFTGKEIGTNTSNAS